MTIKITGDSKRGANSEEVYRGVFRDGQTCGGHRGRGPEQDRGG